MLIASHPHPEHNRPPSPPCLALLAPPTASQPSLCPPVQLGPPFFPPATHSLLSLACPHSFPPLQAPTHFSMSMMLPWTLLPINMRAAPPSSSPSSNLPRIAGQHCPALVTLFPPPTSPTQCGLTLPWTLPSMNMRAAHSPLPHPPTSSPMHLGRCVFTHSLPVPPPHTMQFDAARDAAAYEHEGRPPPLPTPQPLSYYTLNNAVNKHSFPNHPPTHNAV